MHLSNSALKLLRFQAACREGEMNYLKPRDVWKAPPSLKILKYAEIL